MYETKYLLNNALLAQAYSMEQICNNIIFYMWWHLIDTTSNFGFECFSGRGLVGINLGL